MNLQQFIDFFLNLVPIVRGLIILAVAYIIISLITVGVKKRLMGKARTKKQKSNVEIFTRAIKYIMTGLLLVFFIASFAGSWQGLGLGLGLTSAALGWALQKPITSIAAWIMIIIKRPFEIGDRVIIGNVKGDVEDIRLTHIYLKEVGGMVNSEENSGRTVIIPNSVMFEQNVINYTLQDDYVLSEVIASVTYESDLDKAMNLCLKAAEKHTAEQAKKTKPAYVRVVLKDSGIDVHVRYFVKADRIQELSSLITKEIYDRFKKEKYVSFAYPHTEVIMHKK